MPEKKDTVLQSTDHGDIKTPVDEIPLSDKAGEGRREPRDDEPAP